MPLAELGEPDEVTALLVEGLRAGVLTFAEIAAMTSGSTSTKATWRNCAAFSNGRRASWSRTSTRRPQRVRRSSARRTDAPASAKAVLDLTDHRRVAAVPEGHRHDTHAHGAGGDRPGATDRARRHDRENEWSNRTYGWSSRSRRTTVTAASPPVRRSLRLLGSARMRSRRSGAPRRLRRRWSSRWATRTSGSSASFIAGERDESPDERAVEIFNPGGRARGAGKPLPSRTARARALGSAASIRACWTRPAAR